MDFQKLNTMAKFDASLMPSIDEEVEKVGQVQVMSSMDIN